MAQTLRWLQTPVAAALAVTLTLASAAYAQAAAPKAMSDVFVRALVDGRAMAPVPDTPLFGPALEQLKRQAGGEGPIVIQAMRIVRFEGQAHCGRVVFGFAQPSSHKAWADLGGQLNICEDGQAPLRICGGEPRVLVPANRRCRDKSAPIDTPEVAAAIQAALVGGNITGQQVKERARAAQAAEARAAKEATLGSKP